MHTFIHHFTVTGRCFPFMEACVDAKNFEHQPTSPQNIVKLTRLFACSPCHVLVVCANAVCVKNTTWCLSKGNTPETFLTEDFGRSTLDCNHGFAVCCFIFSMCLICSLNLTLRIIQLVVKLWKREGQGFVLPQKHTKTVLWQGTPFKMTTVQVF